MPKTIWLRVKLPEKELRALFSDFTDCEFLTESDGAIGNESLQRIEGVFTEEALPNSLVQQMPTLAWLHVTRGGVNTYLTPAIKARPILVTGSKGIHGTVFSEFALACILMLAKKLPDCIAAQREKHWQKLVPTDVEGKTLGIVGLGRAGSDLAQKAKALGLRVFATKRTESAKPDFVEHLGTPEFLPELLAESDFVVLLLASVPSTFKIIGENELRRMKPSAYLINLTGGRAIDEALLVRALKEHWMPEPCSTPSRVNRCRLTPNCGVCPMSLSRRASPASPTKNGPRCCQSSEKICSASLRASRFGTLSISGLVID